MKSTFDPEDIEAIAGRVVELLRPHLARRDKSAHGQEVLNVTGLAEYLHVKESWVYKQKALGSLPYIKQGKYLMFRKSAIDKWLETHSVNALMP